MDSIVIVKLGGSVITDKSRECTPDLETIHRAADEITTYHRPLILLHGGGSYAHPFVTRVGLQKGFKGRFQLKSISETELHLDQLTRIIGVSLLLRKKPFVPVRPMSFITLKDGRVGQCFLRPIVHALRLGLVPLIHGDIAFDEVRGCGVVSADRIASLLGEKLNVSRVLFGCDVDGVYTQNPKTSHGAKLIEQVTQQNFRNVLGALGKNDPTDATGGMRGKVFEAIRLARHGSDCYIFNLRREFALKNLLQGTSPQGTRFSPWRRRF